MEKIPQERRLLHSLQRFTEDHGYSPTIQEMKTMMEEKSSSKVQDLLASLCQKGLIRCEPNKARTYRPFTSSIWLRGVVEAGYLVEHPWSEGELINLWGQQYQTDDYALRVCGQSMVKAHIHPGDLVVIRPSQDLWALKSGQIAVVWIEGEGATLKHLYCQEEGDWVRLEASGREQSARTIERHQVGLQGVMVGQHRYGDGLWVAVDSDTGSP
ncbi:MAG: LexA family protein [Nodosilinea sp.]